MKSQPVYIADQSLKRPDGLPGAAHVSHPGMAHFAGTGPEHARCSDCAHFEVPRGSDLEGRCQMYRVLMRQKSSNIRFPASTMACKYFEPAKR